MKKSVLAVLTVASVVLTAGCGQNVKNGDTDEETPAVVRTYDFNGDSDEETPAVVRTYDFSGFDRIIVGRFTGFKRSAARRSIVINNTTYRADILTVNIVKSDEYSVSLSVFKEENADQFDVTQDGDRLTVWVRKPKDDGGENHVGRSVFKAMKQKDDREAEVTICLPGLRGLTVESSANVIVDGSFEMEDDFSIDITGATNVVGLDVKAGRIDVDVTGVADFKDCNFTAQDRLGLDVTGVSNMAECALTAGSLGAEITGTSNITGTTAQFATGKLEITGVCNIELDSAGNDSKGTEATCGSLDMEVDGVAKVDLSGLRCRDVRVDAGGLSMVKVYATESLWYDADDLSSVKYYGKPAEVNGDKGDECR